MDTNIRRPRRSSRTGVRADDGKRQLPVVYQLGERIDTRGQFPTSDRKQTRRPHAFDAEATERCSKEHGLAQAPRCGIGPRRQVTQKSSCKGVAGSRWIDGFLERKCGNEKRPRLIEEERPELASFDDERLWPSTSDVRRGFDEIVDSRKLPGLLVIDDQKVDALQDVRENLGLAFNPEVHGIGHDELGRKDLIEHGQLKARIDIPEEDQWTVRVGGGNLGRKSANTFSRVSSVVRLTESAL